MHIKNSVKIIKPWGYELIFAHTDKYIGKMLYINAGHRLSLQYHEEKEETVLVISGTLYVYDSEGSITKFFPGEHYHVAPGQIHRFGASEKNVELIEVSTNHPDDVIRISDDYARA